MRRERRRIRVGPETEVSSVWAIPDEYRPDTGTAVILAHGAGNDMEHPFLAYQHEGLARKGHLCVKFNFPYKEVGRRAPDPARTLESTWKALIAALRGEPRLAPSRLVLGGKSMGGRIVSQIIAGGTPADGLVFLGYPLHPPRRTDETRVEHLLSIRCPMLFIQGSRDPLCNLELLRLTLARLQAPTRLHVVEGGEHSFQLPKRMERSEAQVWEEILRATSEWLDDLR